MKTSEILTYKRVGAEREKQGGKTTEILFAIIGLLAGRVEIWGMVMPTAVSWGIANATLDEKNSSGMLASVLYTAAGMMLSGFDILKLRCLVTLAIIYFLKKTNNKLFTKNVLISGALGAFVNFNCGVIILAVMENPGFDYILLTLEAVLIVGASTAFKNAAEIINRGGTVLGDDEGISLFFMAALAVAGVNGIGALGMTLSSLLSLYMIAFVAKKSGIGISVTLAAVLSIVAGEADVISAFALFTFMAIGCSLFRSIGRFGTIMGAVFANTIYVGCRLGGDESVYRIGLLTASAVLFFFTPQEIIDRVAKYTSRQALNNSTTSRLAIQKNETNKAISDIEEAISGMAEVVKEMNADRKAYESSREVIKKVSRCVCKECALKSFCSGKNREKTQQAIDYILQLIEKTGDCDVDAASKALSWKCIHAQQVVEKVQDAFEFYREQNMAEKRRAKNIEYAINGLEDMAEIINRQRTRLLKGFDTYDYLSEEIAENLVRNGIMCTGVCVIKNRTGLFEVTAEIETGDLGFAEDIIKEIMKLNMKTVAEEKTKKGTVLCLREKEHYAYEVAVMTLDNKERSTGDSTVWFDDGKGNLHCLVGDGMGSGTLAAKESGWTVKLFEKLTTAGFEPGEAFRMINNVMISGKPGESCISADAVKVNLYNGTAEFTKAGAASSYIKTKKGAEKIGWSSLPLGILEICETESRCCDISDGGYIVLMSDGVPDNAGDRMEGEHLLRRALEECDDCEPGDVAEHMMFASLAMGAPKDDMTIIVAKIIKK